MADELDYSPAAVARLVWRLEDYDQYADACDDAVAMLRALRQALTESKARAIEPRPLFIPLKREFFEAFEAGTKHEELRPFGPRWNERTCRVGRPVVLSLGYGKGRRLTGRVAGFKRQRGDTFGSGYRKSIEQIYGTTDLDIACIRIELAGREEAPTS